MTVAGSDVAALVDKLARQRRNRPSESLEDGRRWSDGPEFATGFRMATVIPSEMDVMEVGVRVARCHAQKAAAWWEERQYQVMHVLHPAESAKRTANVERDRSPI